MRALATFVTIGLAACGLGQEESETLFKWFDKLWIANQFKGEIAEMAGPPPYYVFIRTIPGKNSYINFSGWIQAYYAPQGLKPSPLSFDTIARKMLDRDPQIESTEAFILARLAREKGNANLFQEAFQRAIERAGGLSLKEVLAAQLSNMTLYAALNLLDDSRVPRPEAKAVFETIVRDFPDGESARFAKAHVETLTRMEARDAAYNRPHLRRTERGQIAIHIHNLQDQEGQVFMSKMLPAVVNPFPFSKQLLGDSPAEELIRIGYPAVPQLAAALKDTRYTRALNINRGPSEHSMLTVGQAVHQILWAILPIKEIDDAEKVLAWYKEYQVHGEKVMLEREILNPNGRVDAASDRLADRYPKEAPAIFAKAIKVVGPMQRAVIARSLRDLKAVDQLRSLMLNDKDSVTRMTAAMEMERLKRGSGLPSMIREWRGILLSASWNHVHFQVARELLISGRVEAVETVAFQLRSRNIDMRLDVIRTIASIRSPRAENYDAALESLLAGLLDDNAIREGSSGSMAGGYSFSNPRVSDMAAHALSRLNPTKYPYRHDLSLKERDAQNATFAATHRDSKIKG